MSAMLVRKNKVVLEDYNFRRDIENRLRMAELSVFEVETLRAILDGSLIIPLGALADSLGVEKAALDETLERLSPTKLFAIQNDKLLVDKEIRKYYESQILKFDDCFEPGMEFLQGLLGKVPIQLLPQWYCLPRNSHNIFQAIVEKFLSTPKIYQRYLAELEWQCAFIPLIINDINHSADFLVRGSEIRRRYGLTLEKFEECMLLLEYNFVGCLSYQRNGNTWEEVVTPFFEWREHLRFLRDSAPRPILDKNIQRTHPQDFGFIDDLSQVLEALAQKPLAKVDRQMREKIVFMQLGEEKNGQLVAKEGIKNWLKKTREEKALTMTRHPTAVEKGLVRFSRSGWCYVDDFLKGFCKALESKPEIALKNKGKRWRYALPEYTDEEKITIKETLCRRLFEAGIVATGVHQGRECFSVTPFGRRILEE